MTNITVESLRRLFKVSSDNEIIVFQWFLPIFRLKKVFSESFTDSVNDFWYEDCLRLHTQIDEKALTKIRSEKILFL